MNLWVGGVNRGGSFPGRGGMSKFLASGGGTPLSHPSRGNPVAPPKKYQKFQPPPLSHLIKPLQA